MPGNDRIELNANGIYSYDDNDRLHGIVMEKTSENKLSDFKLYYRNTEMFRIANIVVDGSQQVSLRAYGHDFLTSSNTLEMTAAMGDWGFNGYITFANAFVSGLEDSGYAIEEEIKSWVSANFAPKNHTHSV
jgi:hypothetical protein